MSIAASVGLPVLLLGLVVIAIVVYAAGAVFAAGARRARR